MSPQQFMGRKVKVIRFTTEEGDFVTRNEDVRPTNQTYDHYLGLVDGIVGKPMNLLTSASAGQFAAKRYVHSSLSVRQASQDVLNVRNVKIVKGIHSDRQLV